MKKSTKEKLPYPYIGIWAAITAVAFLMPSIPIAFSPFTFSVSHFFMHAAAVLFGPIAGAIAVAIGYIIGQFIAPYTAIFGPITFVPATASVFIAGLMMVRKSYYAVILSAANFAMFIVAGLWMGGDMTWIWVYGITLSLPAVIVAFFGNWASKMITSFDSKKAFVGSLIIVLVAVLNTNTMGNWIYVFMYTLPNDLWGPSLIPDAVPRILSIIAEAIVITPIVMGLYRTKKLNFLFWPKYIEEHMGKGS